MTIIFDFDGTIAETVEAARTIFNKLAVKYNLEPIPKSKIDEVRGYSTKQLMQLFPLSPIKKMQLINEVQTTLKNQITQINIVPNLKPVLAALNKKYQLGIVTSNTKLNVELFLNYNKIEMFDFIYTDKSVWGKHRVVRRCIKKENLTTEQTIYIGDETRDVLAAHKNNLECISVTWGLNNFESLEKINPGNVVRTPNELLQKLI